MARLIRTEKEVEGRYEEVWLVVEEDALEQWPAGPREVVGRPATRIDGLERARGEAVYTADLKLPGMLHTAVLRSPHAHARVGRIDLAPALAMPGVHAAIGPGELDVLVEECGYQGAAVAAVCADTLRAGARGRRADRGRVGAARGAARPRRGGRARPAARRAAGARARRPRARPRRGGRRRRPGEYRTQVVLHNSMETHQAVVQWVGDTLEVYISTQYIWGVRDEVAASLGMPADKVRVVCNYMGGGFGSKNEPGRLHVHRDRAREADEPAGALRAHASRGEPRRGQPQRDDPAARRSARAPTARSPRSAAST